METILVSCEDHVLELRNMFVLFVGDRLIPHDAPTSWGAASPRLHSKIVTGAAGQAAMSLSRTASSPESLYLG
jgi:hypothetical protein